MNELTNIPSSVNNKIQHPVNSVAPITSASSLFSTVIPADALNTNPNDPKSVQPIVIEKVTFPIQNAEQLAQLVVFQIPKALEELKTRQIKNIVLQMRVSGATDVEILCNAVRLDDLEFVTFFLGYKINPNGLDKAGNTPIHYAAQNGNLEMMTLLHQHHADVNVVSENGLGHSPLQIASEKGFFDCAEFLIQNGANVNFFELKKCCTALYLAARNNHEKIVLLLIQAKANPSITNIQENTPLEIAEINKHVRIVDILKNYSSSETDVIVDEELESTYKSLLKPFESKEKDSKSLVEAAEQGIWYKVVGLSARLADVNFNPDRKIPALHYAASNGFLKIVKFLVEKNADVNLIAKVQGTTPLHFSSQAGHIRITRFLVERGVKVNQRSLWKSFTPLYLAANGNHIETVQFLLDNGADPSLKNIWGKTAQNIAEEKEFTEILDILTKHQYQGTSEEKDDIDYKSMLKPKVFLEDDGIPLQKAAETGIWYEVVGLVQRGANINFVNKENPTSALHHAAKNGFLQVIELLVQNGANVNIEDVQWGSTPLHHTCQKGFLNESRYLVASGALVNKQNSQNAKTALHFAIEKGHAHIVEFLISMGADPSLTDIHGESSLDLAKRLGHTDILKIMSTAKPKKEKIEYENRLEEFADWESYKKNERLVWSSIKGYWQEVVQLINQEKCDTNYIVSKVNLDYARATKGYRALHAASNCGFLKVMEFLVENGANINLKDDADCFPIHFAAGNNQPGAFRFLLEKGADHSAKFGNISNFKNKTIREVATEKNFTQILDILNEYERKEKEKPSILDKMLKLLPSSSKKPEKSKALSINGETSEQAPSALGIELQPILKSTKE